MAMSIRAFRGRGSKPVETPQESVQKEPPVLSDAPPPLKAEEISAATERLKQIRRRLQGNRAVEAFRLADRSLPTVLSNINSKAIRLAKNRAQILLEGGDPDTKLRRVGEEKRQAEKNVADLRGVAVAELQRLYHECNETVGTISSRAWHEWSAFRRELLDFVRRHGDLDARLGLPVGRLAQEADNFNSEFDRIRSSIPDTGAIEAPVRVPKLGRGYSWNEFQKVVHVIKAWLI